MPEQPSSAPGRLQTSEPPEQHASDVIPMHHPIMREMSEPQDGNEPTPLWLLMFYFALVGWGGWYLAMNSGDFQRDILTDDAMQPGIGLTAPAPAPVDPLVLGKRVFNNCVTCHQQNGEGVTGTYPPLAGSELVHGQPETLARILLHGLHGPLTIKGATYNGDMPAWDQLKDQQIAAVLTYVRASWDNGAPAIPVELITTIRKETQGRTQPWTWEELKRMETAKPE